MSILRRVYSKLDLQQRFNYFYFPASQSTNENINKLLPYNVLQRCKLIRIKCQRIIEQKTLGYTHIAKIFGRTYVCLNYKSRSVLQSTRKIVHTKMITRI